MTPRNKYHGDVATPSSISRVVTSRDPRPEVITGMQWRVNGNWKCPRCGGRMTYYSESEGYNGSKVVRYVIRCKSCGYKEVLQEVEVKRVRSGLMILRKS